MSVITNVTVTVEMKETSVDGKAAGQDKFNFSKTYTFVDAAGVLGATKCWGDSMDTTTTPTSLDLAGGVVDKLGQTETFTKAKVFLGHHDGETGLVTFGGGSNPFVGLFTGTIPLGADGLVLIVNPTAAGGTVTAGTGDLLQVVASAGTIAADAAIAGE